MAGSISSPLGMLTMFVITVYLFFYTHPVLAVLYVFVAYELLNRSVTHSGPVPAVKYVPSNIPRKKNVDTDAAPVSNIENIQNVIPSEDKSLEEEIINKMAPIGHSEASVFTETSFKPVANAVGAASMF